ncbi:solute carrier family 22 member 8-like isoform X2 [Tachyglossus aculeatus]|uniref:solute carrier family 22 member 8-like isoform X2 n=1 Tax=Tachyglossus aculeatus TaxID=9261 RepID=UPI0018F44EF6|nr:solute carrier family 22 member 8-like isoform X2 [Tachyglossus aculeatus]
MQLSLLHQPPSTPDHPPGPSDLPTVAGPIPRVPPNTMTFAEILEQVGSLGFFQIRHLVLLSIPVLMMASHNLLQIFSAATPAHHCRPPPNSSGDGTHAPHGLDPQTLLRVWVPLGPDGEPERCRRYTQPQWHLAQPNASLPNGTQVDTEPCQDGWSYDHSMFTSTIVTEWDLVCESRKLKEMAQSVYMAGVLIGGIVFGPLSDRFGRKLILAVGYLLLAVTSTCTAFSPNLTAYVVFRFLNGFSFSGISLSTTILCIEWVPMSVRAIQSTLTGYCYTLGQFILPGLAYAIPEWRWLQLAVSVPFFIFFLCIWWIAESVRWLVLTGKPEKALRELQRVATCNGKKEEGKKLSVEELIFNLQKEISSAKVSHSAVDLLRTPTLRLITCCISLVWFATGFAYYSLAMDLEGFGVNVYLLQVIFGGVDIPAKFIAILTISYLGRRTTQAMSLILAGGVILSTIFVPHELQTLRTGLAVFGKGCLSASFSCVFLYTGELYPTVIRQTAMGICNTWTRVGSMLAPLVKIIGEVSPFIPFIIYGTVPIVAGSASLLLPETLNVPLPETIEDVENRKRGRKKDKEDYKMKISLHYHDLAKDTS